METTIKIKETSKSGVIACIDGIYGQLRNGDFIPYTQEQLEKKTAYRDDYGWDEYSSIDEYKKHRDIFNEERKRKNAELERMIEATRIEENERLQAMIAQGAIPATIENIRLLLKWLNEQNWGGWHLPKMTIGYSAHQYDCDGIIASTITLNEPISDISFGIDNETKFKVGGKRGHLINYRSL